MPQQYRFTGANARIDFNGVTVSNDYTELTVEFQMRVEEKTAGSDADASYNPTVKEGKATLKLFDTGESGVSVAQALRVGQSGSLTVWPNGNVTGKPVLSFPALVTRYTEPIKFDKNTVIQVEFLKNGAATQDVGSLQ